MSVMSISPTGLPAASTTGSSLIFRSAMISTASDTIEPVGTVVGRLVITCADRAVEGFVAAAFEQPGQIAIGENAAQDAVRIDDHHGPGAARRPPPFDQHLPHALRTIGHAAIGQRPHLLFDFRQLPPQAAARMKSGKIFAAERSHPADDQRQRIADGQHRRRARAGSQAQRASFLQRPEIERHLRRSGERAGAMARDGDDRHRERRERRQQPNDFLRFAAMGEDEHQIGSMDSSEVAVDGFAGVQKVASGAGRGERRGDLLADQSGLADPGDDHASRDIDTVRSPRGRIRCRAVG